MFVYNNSSNVVYYFNQSLKQDNNIIIQKELFDLVISYVNKEDKNALIVCSKDLKKMVITLSVGNSNKKFEELVVALSCELKKDQVVSGNILKLKSNTIFNSISIKQIKNNLFGFRNQLINLLKNLDENSLNELNKKIKQMKLENFFEVIELTKFHQKIDDKELNVLKEESNNLSEITSKIPIEKIMITSTLPEDLKNLIPLTQKIIRKVFILSEELLKQGLVHGFIEFVEEYVPCEFCKLALYGELGIGILIQNGFIKEANILLDKVSNEKIKSMLKEYIVASDSSSL